MSPLKPAIALLAAALCAMGADARAESADPASSACVPRLVSGPTAFPADGHRSRTGGTVALDVIVAADGDVQDARVIKSSGSRLLDRAAVRSAVSDWKFAAAPACASARISQGYIVVRYAATPAYTFSAMRAPGYRNELRGAAERGCEISPSAEGDFVMSCIAHAASDPRTAGR